MRIPASGAAREQRSGQVGHGLRPLVGRQGTRGVDRALRFGLCRAARVFEAAAAAHDRDDPVELLGVAVLDRLADQRRLVGAAALQRADHGQGDLALAQVVAQVLAELGGIALVVEHVVDDLERRAERLAVVGAMRLGLHVGSRQHGGQAAAGLEQLGGLGADHAQVGCLVERGVMHVHELQHLALRDHVGRVGQYLHHAHLAGVDHHLEGARVEEVAHQHAGGVAEHLVGGIAAAPQRRLVDHVVVQQRRGVDELDHGRQAVAARVGATQCAAGQQQQGRAHTLAAGADDVLRDLADQRHVAVQAVLDHAVDRLHVGGDQGQGMRGGFGRRAQDGGPDDFVREL